MTPTDDLRAGERRTATILFSDMKGFTSLSERMDPEEMDGLMNRVFGLFEEIIKSQGGMVEKYIGDALVAVFGVPELHEDDAVRAVNAALEFRSRLGDEVGSGAKDLRVSFRTGIHTGLVTTGKRGEFDVVTGHAMSVAQRLEAAAPADGILVSEATKDRCEADFEFSGLREIAAKGKSETVRAWLVQGASSGELNDAGPFIGRREELENLVRTYMRTRSDEVSGFYISGEAGIGKSRLAQALVDKIRLFPDFSTPVLAARAWEHRPGALAVIVDVILDYLVLPPTAGVEEVEAALGRIEGVDAETRTRFAHMICCSDSAEPDTLAIAVLYRIFTTIVARHAGDLFPLLVVIDNAPHMDKLSLAFFQHFLRDGKASPFIVLTGRDFPPELRKAFQGVTALRLTPLSPEASSALALAHWPEAGEEALARVLEASLGNPLFIREYASWARSHHDLSSLPSTVQNIFLATLERYPAAVRDLAKKLSVFTHSFSLADALRVEEVTRGDPGAVAASLAAFVADGLLVPAKDRHSWRIDVFRKAVYASLLNHNKRILHGVVADIVQAGGAADRLHLIHHLLRADRLPEAVGVIKEDPDRTRCYGYLPLIETLLRRLKGDEESSFRLLVTKAALLFNRGRIEDSEAVLRRIMRTAIARRSDSLMGYAYHQICAYNTRTYSFNKAVFTGKKALFHYARAGYGPTGTQNVLRWMSLAQAHRSEPAEALALVERCTAVPKGDPGEATGARAELLLLGGDYRGALAAIDASLAAMPAGLVGSRFFALDLKIKALWQLCDYGPIGIAARELLALGSLSEAALSQANAMLGVSAFLLGEEGTGRDSLVQAEVYAGQVQNDFERLDALRTLAQCRFLAGDLRQAEEAANEGLAFGLRHSCYGPTFSLLVLLAEACLGRGKADRARFFLSEASFFLDAGVLLPEKDRILYWWLASRLLDPAEAGASLATARRLLEAEERRLAEPRLVERLLATRSFARIREAVAGEVGA